MHNGLQNSNTTYKPNKGKIYELNIFLYAKTDLLCMLMIFSVCSHSLKYWSYENTKFILKTFRYKRSHSHSFCYSCMYAFIYSLCAYMHIICCGKVYSTCPE